jgi:nucleoside-diphosphate-sugar epimerase
MSLNLLVCAGLPGEKWKANLNPSADLSNIQELARVLDTVKTSKAILISTVDVFKDPVNVDEDCLPDLSEGGAYGRNRAWFENYFANRFEETLIVRLPGLIAPNLRKNLIFDLMNNRNDQLALVHPQSEFQFFDISTIWSVIHIALEMNIKILNVATEPVSAQEVAGIFGFNLEAASNKVTYKMKSKYESNFGGVNGYLIDRKSIIRSIENLKAN